MEISSTGNINSVDSIEHTVHANGYDLRRTDFHLHFAHTIHI